MNSLASERVGVVASIDPDAYAASTVTSAWVSAKAFHRFLAVVQAGALGTNATLDAKIEQATDASGTGAKDVANKAITQLTQAGGDSDKQSLINLSPDELDVDGGFDHLRVSVTVATATSDAGALLLGLDPRDGPASGADAASVDEIVA